MAKKRPQAPPIDAAGVKSLYERLSARDSSYQQSIDSIYEALGLDTTSPAYTFYREVTERKRFYWEKTGASQDRAVIINLLHTIVEDQRTYLGVQRSVRCPLPLGLYPDAEPTPLPAEGLPPEMPAAPIIPEVNAGEMMTAQSYADFIEKGTIHLWREWDMARKYSLIGWFCAVPGNAIGVLHWSDERNIPVFTVRSPKNAFVEVSPDDDTEVIQAVFMQEMRGTALALEYPECAGLTDDKVKVYDYYDRSQRLRVVEGVEQPVIQAKNPIEKVPVFIFPGILMPGFLGASAMSLAIPIHNEIQRLYSLEAEVLLDAVRAPTIVVEGEKVPEGWFWGEDAVIEVGQGGGVMKAKLDNIDHNLFFHRIEEMKGNLDSVLDFSKLARGDTGDANILTGKGTNAVMRAPAMRMEIRLQTLNNVMERVMQVAFLMWFAKGKKGKTQPIYGKVSGSNFSVAFDPKSINPSWCRPTVYVDSAAFIDRSAAITSRLQKAGGDEPKMSTQRFLELDDDIDDVGVEMARLKKEREERLAWQVEAAKRMQEAMQPPAPPAGAQSPITLPPEGGGAAGPAEAPPQGGGEAPVAPEGPMEPGVGAPGSPPPEDQQALEALATHFRGIKNIHGRVYLVGRTASGQYPPIEVYPTDKTDKATILNSFMGDEMEQIVQEQAIKWYENRPTGQMLDVTPGTEGLTPEPGAEEPEPQLEPGDVEELPVEPGAGPEAAGGPPMDAGTMSQLGELLGGV